MRTRISSVAAGAAALISLIPSAAAPQHSVDCSFSDPDFSGGLIVITPNTARPGDTVEVSWVPASAADGTAMERAAGDPTWSVRLGPSVLYEGEPPHQIGGYRWDNLVVPPDAVDGPGQLVLSRSGADVWSCPIEIEGGAPPTTSTTEAPASSTTSAPTGSAAPQEEEDEAGFTAPLLVGAAAAILGSIGLAWWLRRSRAQKGPSA